MMGEAAQPKGKPAKPPRAVARPKSRAFRWTIRLLFVALSLMITRGVLQTPEIRAMLDDGVAKVLAVLAKERAQQDAMAGAARLEEMQDSAPRQAPAPEMFEDRVAVRRSESPAGPRRLTGPVEAVIAGNAFMLGGVPVVLDSLVCAAPDTEAGRRAMDGLEELTRAQGLRCTVTGAAGEHAVRATCMLKGEGDLALAMQADRLCDAD